MLVFGISGGGRGSLAYLVEKERVFGISGVRRGFWHIWWRDRVFGISGGGRGSLAYLVKRERVFGISGVRRGFLAYLVEGKGLWHIWWRERVFGISGGGRGSLAYLVEGEGPWHIWWRERHKTVLKGSLITIGLHNYWHWQFKIEFSIIRSKDISDFLKVGYIILVIILFTIMLYL